MSMVIENTAYRIRVRSDNGLVLIGQRTYLSQGVTIRGRKWYKDMRWFAFYYPTATSKQNFPGIPAESLSKQQLLAAIIKHPQFTKASKELS